MVSEQYGGEIERVRRQCETHERFLKELVRGNYAHRRSYLPGDLSFGIARRWNSWYPSYFDVEGGCYVLIPGDLDPDNDDNRKDTRVGVVVIDPGFKFIDVLRANYQIEPQDISAVIVTHFHPDHMAGLLEYTTIMNTSKQMCSIYLNETTYATFRALQNAYITVNELVDGQIQEIMRYVTRDRQYVRVTVKAVGVHHNELGNQHRSLGLILEVVRADTSQFERSSVKRYCIGILGDTDGKDDYVASYARNFGEVDVLILHLGTFSNKKLGRGGKHLYAEGVRRVLKRIGSQQKDTDAPKIVILSEFGLELADEDALYRKLQPFIESHSWRLPLIFTGLYLKVGGTALEDDEEGSRFFARATLRILERIQEFSQPSSHDVLTRNELDELLAALAFQVFAFDSSGMRETIRGLQEKLSSLIKKQRIKSLVDKVPLRDYLDLLDRTRLEDDEMLRPLRRFYSHLVQLASFTQVPPDGDLLAESCKFLMERIARNLENIGNVLYYVDKLGYISKYAESRGVEGHGWAYRRGAPIKDLSLFWTACLVGAYLLGKVIGEVTFQPRPTEENSLLRVGAFFREDAMDWASLLVGDIGCTLGIDPFRRLKGKQMDRRDGIWLRSAEGQWISPFKAECFFDSDNDGISYR